VNAYPNPVIITIFGIFKTEQQIPEIILGFIVKEKTILGLLFFNILKTLKNKKKNLKRFFSLSIFSTKEILHPRLLTFAKYLSYGATISISKPFLIK
jgi:hypothetical protein